MNSRAILHYTAFTTTPTGGNPAGVVLDASSLTDAEQQRIATALRYSESAFLTPTEHPGAFGIRYFSPLAEVPFCGHATIASAVALAERLGPQPLLFHSRVGDIPITTARDASNRITASLRSVATSSRPATSAELTDAVTALRWSAQDVELGAYPPHVAFAGNHHLVLAARTRDRLARLDYDFDALGAACRTYGWTTVHLFHAETPALFHVRDPFPIGGVKEDPATGSAAAAFGGYLRTLRPPTARMELTLLQGHDMGRPSTLLVTLEPDDARVTVTGTAVAFTPAPAGKS